MPSKSAISVARRCLCLELLAQRLVLETDTDAPEPERETGRSAWLARVGDLGIGAELSDDERALLDRPVGQLDEDALDDLHGRAVGAAVLLWALGRTAAKPTFAVVEAAIGDGGLLGDGSISAARAAAESAKLRSDEELLEAFGAYKRLRGKAREVDDPERIFAGVAAHHIAWITTEAMDFEEDVALD